MALLLYGQKIMQYLHLGHHAFNGAINRHLLVISNLAQSAFEKKIAIFVPSKLDI
jgi:hypothetical protein